MQDKKSEPPPEQRPELRQTALLPPSQETDPGGLWQRAARDFKPLKPAPEKEQVPSPVVKRRFKEKSGPPLPAVAVLPSESGSHGLDRRSKERLRKGEYRIDAQLDLHGFTQSAGHTQLIRFLKESYASGLRCVLVITGKGKSVQHPRGVLRQNLRVWLESQDVANLILGTATALPRHGGEGALYVLLRRNRSMP